MSDNIRSELTSKQKIAAEALASGASYQTAALAARVHARTLRRWLDTDVFVAGVREYQRKATEGHLRALTGELAEIRSVILAARDDTEACLSLAC